MVDLAGVYSLYKFVHSIKSIINYQKFYPTSWFIDQSLYLFGELQSFRGRCRQIYELDPICESILEFDIFSAGLDLQVSVQAEGQGLQLVLIQW